MSAILIWKIYCNGYGGPSILLCIYCQYMFWFRPNTIKITAAIVFVAIIISLKVESCAEYKYLIKTGYDSALRWVSYKHYVFPRLFHLFYLL